VFLLAGGAVVLVAYVADPSGDCNWRTKLILFAALVLGLVFTGWLLLMSLGSWLILALLGLALLALDLGVAARTHRFAWFGCALFVSIVIFGGLAAYLSNRSTPQVQVAALLRGPNDRGLFGLYVARNDQRVYLGRLDEKTVYVYPCKDVTALAVGELRPLKDPDRPEPGYESVVEEGTRLRLELLAARSRGQGVEVAESGAAKPRRRKGDQGPVTPVPTSPSIC
jgi:hypothetical protein